MPTREGVVLLILSVAIFLLATNLMSGLLFVLDALLGSVVVVGVLTAVLPVFRMTVVRRLQARGVEGQALPIGIELVARTGGRFITVEDGWPGARAKALVPRVARRMPLLVTLRPIPTRRGRYEAGPLTVTSRGPLGLFAARRRMRGREDVLIWPRVHPVPPAALARLAPAFAGQAGGERVRRPDDVYGVRDFRPGDTPAAIHWISSARRGALVVREFERPKAAGAAIVLDLDRRQPAGRFDAAVRAAASVLHAALERGVDAVVLAWNGELVECGDRETAMDYLAAAAPAGPPLEDALTAICRATDRQLIVVASRAPVALPEGATAVVPAGEAGPDAALVYTEDGAVQAW